MGNLSHQLASLPTTADYRFSKLAAFSQERLKLQQIGEIGQRKPSSLSSLSYREAELLLCLCVSSIPEKLLQK